MQDQKKVGPNLKDVRVKLRKEWVPYWLENPQVFRPGHQNADFLAFRCAARKRRARTCATRTASNKFRPSRLISGRTVSTSNFPNNNAVTPVTANNSSKRAAVSPVTRSVTAKATWAATFAANLQRVGEKSNFDYIVRWIHNPRERVAPYCPKEKRDLTHEDYAKKDLPFVFDTELHSRCPNDGVELQVQNMTVMPNFRLSEQDSRDIATYLFSLSSPPSYASAAFMDDPNLKEKGHDVNQAIWLRRMS